MAGIKENQSGSVLLFRTMLRCDVLCTIATSEQSDKLWENHLEVVTSGLLGGVNGGGKLSIAERRQVSR